MEVLQSKFMDLLDVKAWCAPILDPSRFGVPNDGNFARGDKITQLFHIYPELKDTLYFFGDFEREYNPEPVLNWMKNNNYVLPIGCVIAYVLFVFWLGPMYMKDRKPFKMKGFTAGWNLFLSLFSFYGASRTVPWLIYRVMNEDFEDTVCKSAHVGFGAGAAGLATQLFIISKIPELVDTVILVLLKKEVIFLHWYHHITVLLYCWNSYVTESAAGLWFVAMNYSVHAMMYFYYFLATTKNVPKAYPTPVLTVFQISQMIVGTSVVCACYYYSYYGTKTYNYKVVGQKGCDNIESNLFAGGLMYASYLYLFVEFFFKKYLFGIDDYSKPAANEKEKADADIKDGDNKTDSAQSTNRMPTRRTGGSVKK